MEQHYILNAIEAALRAGGQILSIYNDPSSDFQVERKADNSPLTIADRKAHETIVEILKDTLFPILSEEGKSLPFEMRNGWETLWIVDPLDGTKEFIKRNGEFTINIALVLKGKPVMGVIYVPVKKVLYFAEDTLGAYKIEGIEDLDHKSLDDLISEAVRLPDKSISRTNFVMVASRSHLTSETEIYIDKMRAVHGDLELVSIGSSLKICLVAEGRADVYPRFAPTMEWDTAAGHAIASAAGMEVYQAETDLPLQYNKQDLLNPWFVVEKKHEREIK